MELVVLLLVVAGFALIVGAREFADDSLRAAIYVGIALCLFQCLISRCSGRSVGTPNIGGGWLVVSAVTVALSVIGYGAWRTRASRATRRDAERRRNASPRERELPPPPISEAEDVS